MYVDFDEPNDEITLNGLWTINVGHLRSIANFLYENEQYGDDWTEELDTLNALFGALEYEYSCEKDTHEELDTLNMLVGAL